jgi:hypothetical protein
MAVVGKRNIFQKAVNLDLEVEKTVKRLEEVGFRLRDPILEVSIDKYREFSEKWKKRVRTQTYNKSYTDEGKRQIAEERQALDTFKVCPGNTYFTAERLQSYLAEIDMPKFNKMLTGDFYNDATMNAMVCISGSAHLASSSSLAPNERIRAWIRNLRRVGADSASGYAAMADAGFSMDGSNEAKAPFIVKALRNLDDVDEMRHEAFIGLMATNHLRKFIPNFAYIYGLFECSAPIAGPITELDAKGKKVATFCNSTGKPSDTVQLIYENITPGKGVNDLLGEWDGKTFMRYFIAILMALHVAFEKYKFTHYDLHDGNVLIRECRDDRYLAAKGNKESLDFYVEYKLNFGNGTYRTFYVASPGGIPTIIDYGRCYVEVDGKGYGMPDSISLNNMGLFNDRSNPMYDAFKFLGFCLSKAYKLNNYKLFADIAPLFRYFNTDERIVETLQDLDRESYYSLPVFTKLPHLNDFIDFAIKYSDAMGYTDVVTETLPNNSFILRSASDKFTMNIYNSIGVTEEKLGSYGPGTILEVYDVLTKLRKAYDYYTESEKLIGTGKMTQDRIDIIEKYGDVGEDKQSLLSIRRSLLEKFRSSRDAFLRNKIDLALKYEVDRLADTIANFCLISKSPKEIEAVLNKFKAYSINSGNAKDIGSDITARLITISLPKRESVSLYYTEEMLNNMKNYIGRFALFAEMRQTMLVSVSALSYLYAAVVAVKPEHRLANHNEQVAKIYKLYSYLFDLVDYFEPTYIKFKKSLEVFLDIFSNITEVKDGYRWYKDIATTLPSLFVTWDLQKKSSGVITQVTNRNRNRIRGSDIS